MAHSLFFISQMLAIAALSLISSLFLPFCPSIHSLSLSTVQENLYKKRTHCNCEIQTKKANTRFYPQGYSSLYVFQPILGNSSRWSRCLFLKSGKEKAFCFCIMTCVDEHFVRPLSVMQNAFVVTKPRRPLLYWLRNPRRSRSFPQCNAIVLGISQ